MTPGDALAARIREYVSAQVSPDLVDIVTVTVIRAITTLMAEPSFTNQLQVVASLHEENQWLKSQVIQLQRVVALATSQTRSVSTSSQAKRRSTSKKATTPKPSTARLGGTAPRSAKANFIKGVRQAKR